MDLHYQPLTSNMLKYRLLNLVKHYGGYSLAIVGLIWVLHNFECRALWLHLASMNWLLVMLAIVCDILSYVCQGLRWQLLLKPIGKLSLWQSTRAIYAALFTNEILPMRLGELLRLYLVAKSTEKKVTEIIPSMVMERFLDGVWLALSIAILAIFLPLPKDLQLVSELLIVIVILATIVLLYLGLSKQARSVVMVGEDDKRSKVKFYNLIKTFAHNTITQMQRMVRSHGFYLAACSSLALLLLQILAFWLIMYAYGLTIPLGIAAAVFLIVHLGTMIPNAPANIGSYHFFCVLGLMLFGVNKAEATGFAIVVFALLTLPLLLIGIVAINQTGLMLKNIPSTLTSLTRLKSQL